MWLTFITGTAAAIIYSYIYIYIYVSVCRYLFSKQTMRYGYSFVRVVFSWCVGDIVWTQSGNSSAVVVVAVAPRVWMLLSWITDPTAIELRVLSGLRACPVPGSHAHASRHDAISTCPCQPPRCRLNLARCVSLCMYIISATQTYFSPNYLESFGTPWAPFSTLLVPFGMPKAPNGTLSAPGGAHLWAKWHAYCAFWFPIE